MWIFCDCIEKEFKVLFVVELYFVVGIDLNILVLDVSV